MLEDENLWVRYGTVEAVRGISFSVPAGSIVSLIGSNGAGKTTSLRALTGLVKPGGGARGSRAPRWSAWPRIRS